MAAGDSLYDRMTQKERDKALEIFGRQMRGEISTAEAERQARENERNAQSRPSCPAGTKWDPQSGKCVPVDQPNIFGPANADTPVGEAPVEEVPADQATQAYIDYLKQQAEEQKRQQQQSAKEVITDLLAQYGLEPLTQFVNDLIFKEDLMSGEAILSRIRSDKGTAGETYWARFAGNKLRRNAGMNVLSEAEYLAMENTYRQIMRSAAIPANLFDKPDDLANLIGGDVSPQELSSRINDGYLAVSQANPEVVTQMRRLYGLQDGELAAYFLDPERTTPYLLRQARSAQIAGQAKLQAGQEITMGQAEQLATAGVTQEQAQQGFQTIAQSQELFNPLAGTTETTIGVEEQIAGIFGQSAAAQQRIRQRQRERQAAFEAGGRFAGQGGTVTGLQ